VAGRFEPFRFGGSRLSLGLASRHAEQNGAVKPTAAAMLCPMGDSPPAHLQPRNPPAPPLTGTEGSNPPPSSGESGANPSFRGESHRWSTNDLAMEQSDCEF
jgi:hypothetical protein